MNNYDQKLISFISEQSGVRENQVNYDSVIEDDLGVTGEDAEELIIQFSKIFKVNIDNFSVNKYFYPEPFLFSSASPKPKYHLTIGHLAKAITSGRLADPDIQDD